MKTARFVSGLLCGAALLPGGIALAADTVAPVPVRAKPVTAIEDVTVTATRRPTSIQRVPLSVSAFSQATLDQKAARTIADVVLFTPGVSFDPENNNVSIRGIDSEAGAGTTGIYIDDTPVQIRNLGFNAENSLPELFDLERVEVLRGPQGTLFGAGAEGGVVRYITPQPSLTTNSTYARSVVAGSPYGGMDYNVGAAIGGPIVKDVLGFRISASYEKDGGYLDHENYQTGDVTARNTNDVNLVTYRAALAWQPAPGLTITPSVFYQSRLHGDADVYFEGLSDPGKDQFRTNAPEFITDTDRFYIATLNAKYDLAGVSIISNTSYLHRNNVTGYEGTVYNLSFYNTFLDPGSPYFPLLLPTGINPLLPNYSSPSRIANQQRNITQEIRVQSSDDAARLTWLVGFFYAHERQLSSEQIQDPDAESLFGTVFDDTIEDFFGAPLHGIDSYINQTNAVDEQEAGFANATYRILDGLKLDGGIRFSHTSFSFTNFADGSQNGGYSSGAGASSENPLTGKISLSWQIDPRDMVYASYSRGFREGGANAPVPEDACAQDFQNFGINATPTQYTSDTVDSYEVGAKTRPFGDWLQIDASLYTINWDNIQQNVLLPICGIQYTANLGKAVSRGFELEATIRPIEPVAIDTSLSYDDAHLTQDVATGANDQLLAEAGNSVGDGTSGNGVAHWKFSVGAQYTVPAEQFAIRGGQPYLRADYQYIGRPAGTTPFRDPDTLSYDPGFIRTDATNNISMRAGVTFTSGLDASVFVTNLLNATPLLTHEHETYGSLLNYDTTLPPRYVGIQLTYRN